MKSKIAVQKAVKPRRTLAKQIRELVSTDIRAARQLAERGRQFSNIETRLNLYYQSQHELKQLTSGQKKNCPKGYEFIGVWREMRKATNIRLIEKYAEKDKESLIKVFLDAVNVHDSKIVFEIGNAIEFLKTDRSSDRYRPALLTWKWILDKHGERLPIREVATLIGWHDMDSADGFSQLRGLCVEIKFPLLRSRQIRKRKPS